MRLQKVDGLYRKPGLRASTNVPLSVWLSIVLVLSSVILVLVIQTHYLIANSEVTVPSVRKHSWHIVAVGDIACSPSDPDFNSGFGLTDACAQKAVGEAVEKEKADAVILLGDIQYDVGSFTEFEKSFIPYWRDITVPIYAVAGNHDYASGSLNDYKKAFDTYMPNVTYEKEGATYYSQRLGQWDLYVMDSNCEYVGGCNMESPQTQWLTSKLSNDSSICKITAWHHPLHTSGKHKADPGIERFKDFWMSAQAGGVDVLLNGHDHHFERFAPKDRDGNVSSVGMRQFIVGSGGHSLRPVSEPFAVGQEKVIDNTFGYLSLLLFPGRYEWEYKNVVGDVLDSGFGTCR